VNGDAGFDPAANGRGFARSLVSNLHAGVLLASFRREGLARVRATVSQFVVLSVLGVVIALTFDVARIGSNGEFLVAALLENFEFVLVILAAAWLGTRLAGQPGRLLETATAIAALGVPIGLAWQGLSFLPQDFWRSGGAVTPWLWWLPLYWYGIAAAVATIRIARPARFRGVAVAFVVASVLVLPAYVFSRPSPLWTEAASSDESKPGTTTSAASEALLYTQSRLLDAALERVERGRRGQRELFYLGFAGHGEQNVFATEVTAVERLTHERFAAKGRTVVLANDRKAPSTHPFATKTSLKRALATMAQRMDAGEDVLLLFLTSHGTSDHRFDISLWPYSFDHLTPAELRAALDESGVQHRIVVVSACYSGGFVDALASPNTLVITAARKDRNSFGCEDGVDWTYFGRAYFADALANTNSFERAFGLAKPLIAEREKAAGHQPSEPQLVVGAEIKPVLAALEKALDPVR